MPRPKAGTAAEYKGIMVKRGEPEESDYVTLEPGKPSTATFNLAAEYELKRPGQYTVKFKGSSSLNKLPDSNVVTVDVR